MTEGDAPTPVAHPSLGTQPQTAEALTLTPKGRRLRVLRGAETFACCPECGSPANITLEVLRERLAMVDTFAEALRTRDERLEKTLDDARSDLEMLIRACLAEVWPYKMFNEEQSDTQQRCDGV